MALTIQAQDQVGQQECQKETNVVHANTVVDPPTVVIKSGYTPATEQLL